MKRYSGESLPSNPHIVVLGSCKVGNFVVSTCSSRFKNPFPIIFYRIHRFEVTSDFESHAELTGVLAGIHSIQTYPFNFILFLPTTLLNMALLIWLSISTALIL